MTLEDLLPQNSWKVTFTSIINKFSMQLKYLFIKNYIFAHVKNTFYIMYILNSENPRYLLPCLFKPEIMHGGTTEVFLHH